VRTGRARSSGDRRLPGRSAGSTCGGGSRWREPASAYRSNGASASSPGADGYGAQPHGITALFLEANAPLPATGVKHWRDKMTDEQYAVLESLPWPQASRDELIDASLAVGRALIQHGRPIAERLGVPWPQPLEDAVRAHLERELGVVL
jgi:hypothetical protein